MENSPSQCFFTGAEKRIRAGIGARFARRKEQYHILYRAHNDDITANKRQQLYYISVEHTAPHRRGGANQNDHRPHPIGGGDKAYNDDITYKRQQPYHTSVKYPAPPQAGRGQPKKNHRPHSIGGEGTRSNKTRRRKQQGQIRQLPT